MERARREVAERVVSVVTPRDPVRRPPEDAVSLRDHIRKLFESHPDWVKPVAPGFFKFRAVSERCPGSTFLRYAIIRAEDARYTLVSADELAKLTDEERSELLVTRNYADPDSPLVYRRPSGDPLAIMLAEAEAGAGRRQARKMLGGLVEAGIMPSPPLGETGCRVLALETTVACGKCAHCLGRKAARLRRDARVEIAHTERVGGVTWFGTITWPEAEQYQRLCDAERIIDAANVVDDTGNRVTFHSLSADKRLRVLCTLALPELQKLMKRLRKWLSDEGEKLGIPNAGSLFRYAWACELHASGYPHFHLLLHEQDPRLPLLQSVLEHQWAREVKRVEQRMLKGRLQAVPVYARISRWKKVDPSDRRAVGYVAKYVGKGGLYRASQFYGDETKAAERLMALGLRNEGIVPLIVKPSRRRSIAASSVSVPASMPVEAPVDVPVTVASPVVVYRAGKVRRKAKEPPRVDAAALRGFANEPWSVGIARRIKRRDSS